MPSKVCAICTQEKPCSEFYPKRRYTFVLRRECKVCSAARSKKYAKENPEKVALRHKFKHIRRKYGMSADEYMAKLEAQECRCEICSEPFVGMTGPRSPCVDHNKTTGKNRGLLCRHCNFAIGLAGENVVILHRMIDYIDRHAGFNI